MAWVWRSWWTVASTPAARAVVIQLVSLAGADFYYGRRLYRDVRAVGWVEVDAAVHHEHLAQRLQEFLD